MESALAGRSGVVAVGVPLGLLPPVLAARRRTESGASWRVACRPDAVDALRRARPTEVLSVLRGRFALPLDEDGTLRRGPDGEGRRPVWDRKR
ncbi:hypothetical protein [Halorubrum yunnanense]|uniref:Uncharacterized protein n=1 Tax=Halorubrum yunnanense TaxID=1526162 RepID=A0ABD5YHC5_9EURY|nr:hypothetical protein [Halorubrum yunnanense]